MSNDLKDILGNSNKDIDNQQLMDYLSSQLTKAGEHEVEAAMADDAFVNDAVEGLQQIPDKKNMQVYVEQLNEELQKQIAKNKKRKEKRRLKDSPYTYWAIIILLLLMVICFIAVKKYLDARKVKSSYLKTAAVVLNNTANKNDTGRF
jgi:hypothetical protein